MSRARLRLLFPLVLLVVGCNGITSRELLQTSQYSSSSLPPPPPCILCNQLLPETGPTVPALPPPPLPPGPFEGVDVPIVGFSPPPPPLPPHDTTPPSRPPTLAPGPAPLILPTEPPAAQVPASTPIGQLPLLPPSSGPPARSLAPVAVPASTGVFGSLSSRGVPPLATSSSGQAPLASLRGNANTGAPLAAPLLQPEAPVAQPPTLPLAGDTGRLGTAATAPGAAFVVRTTPQAPVGLLGGGYQAGSAAPPPPPALRVGDTGRLSASRVPPGAGLVIRTSGESPQGLLGADSAAGSPAPAPEPAAQALSAPPEGEPGALGTAASPSAAVFVTSTSAQAPVATLGSSEGPVRKLTSTASVPLPSDDEGANLVSGSPGQVVGIECSPQTRMSTLTSQGPLTAAIAGSMTLPPKTGCREPSHADTGKAPNFATLTAGSGSASDAYGS